MKELFYQTRDGARLSVLYYEAKNSNQPLIIEIHGGGFCYNHNYDDRNLCEQIQRNTGMNVASLDYRLAPKYTFPIPIFDCYDLLLALLHDEQLNFCRDRIFAIGHSAGANAVAALAQLYHGFTAVVLNYPWLDASINKRPYVLGGFFNVQMNYMRKKYLPCVFDRKDPLASPILFSGNFPSTLIISCGLDTLKCDSNRFETRLRERGIRCAHIHFAKAEHGFIEVVPSGRNRRTLLRGKKQQQDQFDCFTEAMKEITLFLKDNNA